MTPDEKRIAWADLTTPLDVSMLDVCHCGDWLKNHRYGDHSPVPMMSIDDLPPYPPDHSAVIAAWRTLSESERDKAVWALHYLIRDKKPIFPVFYSIRLSHHTVFACLTAPADQMLDAFLYAKGALKGEG